MRDLHHAANLHLLKNRFLTRIGPLWNDDSWRQKWWSSWGAANSKNRMSNCEDLSFYRHAWERSFYKNVFFSGEAGILILQSCHVFSWRQELSCQGFFLNLLDIHSHGLKIILWQIIVIMKVDGQYHFIFLISSVAYYSILSLSTLQPTMRCFRIPCIPFLFWPAWLCRNLCLLIS